ncbi:MAG: glycosyltransferase family 1 protein [Candidatus Omnitrophota bacterium]
MQLYGGISRYFYELIRESNSCPQVRKKLSLKYSNNIFIKNLYPPVRESLFFKHNLPYKAIITNRMNLPTSIKLLKNFSEYDLFHPTYYNPYFLKYLPNKPFIITIHDMIHERLPAFFRKNDPVVFHKTVLAQRAAHIIVVSEATKRDVIDILRIPEKKISVVYHGSSMKRAPIKKPDTNNDNGRYLLYVGGRRYYKNFIFFLKSIAPLFKKFSDLKLVCSGGGGFRRDEQSLIKAMNIRERIYQSSCDDKKLSSLYQNAQAFVFPSLYEGFGIPVLEAFANNCPVVCSNTPALSEIAGDAALFFDPQDTPSINNAILSILTNEQLREDLIGRGRRRLESFSWDDTREQTDNIYKQFA